MKPGRLHEVAAAAFFTVGITHGAVAFNANQEAVRAETAATALETQGDHRSLERQTYVSDQKEDRNIFASLAAFELGVAVLHGVTAASRRRQQ